MRRLIIFILVILRLNAVNLVETSNLHFERGFRNDDSDSRNRVDAQTSSHRKNVNVVTLYRLLSSVRLLFVLLIIVAFASLSSRSNGSPNERIRCNLVSIEQFYLRVHKGREILRNVTHIMCDTALSLCLRYRVYIELVRIRIVFPHSSRSIWKQILLREMRCI